jgi:hypothetical protein
MKRKRLQVSSFLTPTADTDTFKLVPSRVRTHLSTLESSKVVVLSEFASSRLCSRLIRLCERQGFRQESDASYTQATVDLEVDASPRLKAFLKGRRLLDALQSCLIDHFQQQIYAFDDVVTKSSPPCPVHAFCRVERMFVPLTPIIASLYLLPCMLCSMAFHIYPVRRQIRRSTTTRANETLRRWGYQLHARTLRTLFLRRGWHRL